MAHTTLAALLGKWDPLPLTEVALELRWAQTNDRSCHLDLSEESLVGTGSPSALRLFIPSVMTLANLLVGRYRNVPVTVRLPESRGLNLQQC